MKKGKKRNRQESSRVFAIGSQTTALTQRGKGLFEFSDQAAGQLPDRTRTLNQSVYIQEISFLFFQKKESLLHYIYIAVVQKSPRQHCTI